MCWFAALWLVPPVDQPKIFSNNVVCKYVASRLVVHARKRTARHSKEKGNNTLHLRGSTLLPETLEDLWKREHNKLTASSRWLQTYRTSTTGGKNFASIPVINVIDSPSYSTSQSLISPCGFWGSVNTQVQEREAADKNAFFFNVPSLLKLQSMNSCIPKDFAQTMQNGLTREVFLLAADTSWHFACVSAFFMKVAEDCQFSCFLILVYKIWLHTAAPGNCSTKESTRYGLIWLQVPFFFQLRFHHWT